MLTYQKYVIRKVKILEELKRNNIIQPRPNTQQKIATISKPVLELKNVTKTFGNRIAVNNISFKINEGEIFGFLGPNGAGKSTTMKMICGLTKITRGNIFVCGKSVKSNFVETAKLVGGLIETPIMYNYMSGYDNLKYYASLHSDVKKSDIYTYARIVGLENRLKDKVGTYSLGMKQRLGICQALLHKPKLLVLDEPLSGLDPAGVKEIRDFLKMLSRKQHIAILVSSHMLGEMEQLCDTIGIINNGQLIEQKTINQLKQGQESTKRVKIKVGSPNFAGKVILNELKFKVDIAGDSVIVHTNEKYISQITEKLVKYKILIYGIEVVSKSLEDIFMEIINKKNSGKHNIF